MNRTIIIELEYDNPHSAHLVILNSLPAKIVRILQRDPSCTCQTPESDDVLRDPATGNIMGRITTFTPKNQPSLPQLLKDLAWSGTLVEDINADERDCCPRCGRTEEEGHADTCAIFQIVRTLTPTHPET